MIDIILDEPFGKAFSECESKNPTKKISAGLKSYLEFGKFNICSKTGFVFANFIDVATGFTFGSGVYCNDDLIKEKIIKCPEKASEYRKIQRSCHKYDFGSRCNDYFNNFDRKFTDDKKCGWGGTWCGHAVPNFIDFAKYGTEYLRDKVNKYSKNNPDNIEFYEGLLMFLDGFDIIGQRIFEETKKLAEIEKDEIVKNKYLRLNKTFSYCPKFPAKTFADACNVYTLIFAFDGIDSPGHFDQYMIDFWRNSDYKESREVLEDLWEFFHDTRTWNLCISGSDENWNDLTNELSYEILDVCRKYKYHTPNLTLRCHRNTPEKLYIEAARTIACGTGMPTLYNDEAVCPALERLGIPPCDSHKYVMNGCNQIDIQGKSHMGLEDGEVNLAKAVEFALNNGKDQADNYQYGVRTGEASELLSFEDFFDAVKLQVHSMTNEVCYLSNKCQRAAAEVVGNPARSLTIEGCIEKGLDHKNHGPLYGHGQILAEGMADAINSIAAVKKYVYEENLFSLSDLCEALRKNFDGYDDMYQILKNSEYKFGNDIEYVDSIAKELIDDFNSYLLEIPTFRGGYYGGGCSPFDRAADYGLNTGALPSGKKRGESLFADSIGSVPGTDVNGPTALIKSCLSFNHKLATSGFILNIKFDKAVFSSVNGQNAFINLWKTYFSNFGQQLSVTVVSKEELIDAQINPEKHKDLIVRVGGFSDYFINLDADLQENVISRTVNC